MSADRLTTGTSLLTRLRANADFLERKGWSKSAVLEREAAAEIERLSLSATASGDDVAELRAMLLEVTDCLADNAAQCKDLHHRKADQHEGHMDCPVEQRIGAVEVRARKLLEKASG